MGGGAKKVLAHIDPVAREPSGFEQVGICRDRRQTRRECEFCDARNLRVEQPVRRHDDGLRLTLGEALECTNKFVGRAGFLEQHRDAASTGGGLDLLCPEPHRCAGGIGEKPDPDRPGKHFKRQLKHLAEQPLDVRRDAGHGAARARIARR